MKYKNVQEKHLYLRLEYFPSLKSTQKADHYTLSSHPTNEDMLKAHKVELCTFNCDCACVGQK